MSLIIGLASDVHSRHGTILPDPPEGIDLYVLAGDIGNPYTIREEIKKFDVPVAYIAGNHEYYGENFEYVQEEVFNNTESCYNNHTLVVKGRRIHLCTLWTHLYDDHIRMLYSTGLNDRRMIDNWSSKKANREHKKSIEFLYDVVEEGDIVFTHHSPSFQSTAKQWIGNIYNPCFHTDLEDLIKEKRPALWGHGHIHDPMDYMIGDTRIVANPYGYPLERKTLNFQHGPYEVKVLEV